MTNTIPSSFKMLQPQPVTVKGDLVVMGDRAYMMPKPENAVRWVMRGGERVLQQCWTVTGQDGNGWMHIHQDWRDVPVEVEEKP